MNLKQSFPILFAAVLLGFAPAKSQTPVKPHATAKSQATGPNLAQPTSPAAQSPYKRTTLPANSPYVRRIDTAKNTDFSLNGQYQFMLSRSRSVNGYKMINPYRLSGVWQSVNDTLKKERQQLQAIKNQLSEQQKVNSSLQSGLSEKEAALNDHQSQLDEIRFLGITFSKTTYHLLVWSIIGILALALVIVVTRSAKNILEARHRTQLYDELSAEYQSFKTRANEKERKLARELQDERNLVEELKGRG